MAGWEVVESEMRVWSKEQEKGWQGSSRGKPEERSPEMREETEAEEPISGMYEKGAIKLSEMSEYVTESTESTIWRRDAVGTKQRVVKSSWPDFLCT